MIVGIDAARQVTESGLASGKTPVEQSEKSTNLYTGSPQVWRDERGIFSSESTTRATKLVWGEKKPEKKNYLQEAEGG